MILRLKIKKSRKFQNVSRRISKYEWKRFQKLNNTYLDICIMKIKQNQTR
jgi:hypothetical protein